MSEQLTAKQENFCREFIIDFNATQAAARAGYSKATAGNIGAENLKKPLIAKRLAELTKEKVEALDITVERVLAELASIAFVDPADLFNDDGSMKALSEIPEQARRAIAGIETKTIVDGRGDSAEESTITKLKTWDKGANLERIGKYLKMFTDTKAVQLPEDCNFTMVVHGPKE